MFDKEKLQVHQTTRVLWVFPGALSTHGSCVHPPPLGGVRGPAVSVLSGGGGTLTDCLDYNRGSNVNKYKEIYIKRDRECERGSERTKN